MPAIALYIGVESIDATVVKVQAQGGTVIVPKTPIPDMGFFAMIMDPQKNVLGIYEDGPHAH